ncbi:MAG: VOC family protein [Acidobacteriota bacterium]
MTELRLRTILTICFCCSLGNWASPVRAAERPPIVGIARIALQVGDLSKARAFYGEFLGFDECFQDYSDEGHQEAVSFKVNDRQFIEIRPGLSPDQNDRLLQVAFETTDAVALRDYLRQRGVSVPAETGKRKNGSLSFVVSDPEGHRLEFVQYLADSQPVRTRGSYLSPRRISDRMLHVGVVIADVVAADRFYKEVLGFSEIWRGGRTDPVTDWINMKVPEGTDYLEYMLVSGKVDRRQLGVLHHLALQVPDIQKSLDALRARQREQSPVPIGSPRVGRNNRWQLNLYDADGTRTELMEPFTIR